MKPTKADRKKFDIDLEYGQIREDKVADIFTKALSRDKFFLFRGYLLNLRNAPAHTVKLEGKLARIYARFARAARGE